MSNYSAYPPPTESYGSPVGEKKNLILTVILTIFLGTLGVHNFYLGFTGKGIAQLVLGVSGWLTTWIFIGYITLTIVVIWAFIELIQMLVNSDFRDSSGQTLKR